MAPAHAKSDKSRGVSLLKAGGVAILAFVVGCFVVGGVTTALKVRGREIASTDAIPPRFPVVVVAHQEYEPRATCRVMFYGDLASAGHETEFSYLVDDAEVPRCKEQIAAQREIVSSGPAGTLPLWSSFVTFSPVSRDGTQEIDLSATWDDDWINRGWYVASQEGVRPIRYQGYGAGVVLVALSQGVAAGIALSLVATTVFVRRKRQSLEEN